ncbi:MAG: hypothetical protein MJ105_07820 [Lachnospiraceae bacterium]|nr:hypothetical protein [Lachnospiraceae bacterium]
MAEDKKEAELKAEKKKIQAEKKKLKNDQKSHQKEAKKRAKELADQEAELDEQSRSGGFSVFVVTLFIILIWIAILCIIIKLDVGGIGSNVMAPLLKNVPVINKILPADAVTETDDLEAYYGYTSLSDAVDQIKALEMELTNARNANTTNISEIEALKAEVERLKTFEEQQVEFQRVKTEFYETVVYADNGPGAEEFVKYYESMDPTTAEELYKQVVKQQQVDASYADYADAYAQMEPAKAAAIFNTMDNNLNLVANILNAMNATNRGKILAQMDPNIAAAVTKIMDPEN